MGQQRANWARGRRFELAVARKFKEAGIYARRHDETSGWYGLGTDLDLYVVVPLLGHRPWWHLPVAVQCKATKRKRDLAAGLQQAVRGQTKAQLWVCAHSRAGAYSYMLQDPQSSSREVTWDEVLDAVRALIRQRKLSDRQTAELTHLAIAQGRQPPK